MFRQQIISLSRVCVTFIWSHRCERLDKEHEFSFTSCVSSCPFAVSFFASCSHADFLSVILYQSVKVYPCTIFEFYGFTVSVWTSKIPAITTVGWLNRL